MKNLRRFVANIILSILLAGAFTLPAIRLFAEMMSDRHIERALGADPFDSRYLARHGKFLLTEGLRKTDGTEDFEKAKSLAESAVAANPYHGEYRVLLGQVKLAMIKQCRKSPGAGKDDRQFILVDDRLRAELKEALADIKKGAGCDQNGFNVAYAGAYSALSFWSALDKEDRDFVINRLKYALSVKPWYADRVYLKTWRHTGDFSLLKEITPMTLASQEYLYKFMAANNLWQYRKEQARIVDLCRQMEMPARENAMRVEKKRRIETIRRNAPADLGNAVKYGDWITYEKTSEHTNNMYSNGTIYAPVMVPPGDARVIVQARGEQASGVYPYMLVELDGKEIGETYIKGDVWSDYYFKVRTDGGVKTLGITFLNDGGAPSRNEDRNLFIGNAKVIS